jgi:hypothetical protein
MSARIAPDRSTVGVITAYKLGERFSSDDQKKLTEAVKIGRLFLSVGAPTSLSIKLQDEHPTGVRSAGHL